MTDIERAYISVVVQDVVLSVLQQCIPKKTHDWAHGNWKNKVFLVHILWRQ